MTTATANPLRPKALAVLREGRLRVLHAHTPETERRPDQMVCAVMSSRRDRVYAVDLRDGGWFCSCVKGRGCAHIAAAQLVAGVES